jgi:hypothetical protein
MDESGPSILPTKQSHSTTRENTYAVFPVDDRLVFTHQPLHFGKVASFDGVFDIFSGHLGGTLRKAGKKTVLKKIVLGDMAGGPDSI